VLSAKLISCIIYGIVSTSSINYFQFLVSYKLTGKCKLVCSICATIVSGYAMCCHIKFPCTY